MNIPKPQEPSNPFQTYQNQPQPQPSEPTTTASNEWLDFGSLLKPTNFVVLDIK